LQRGEDRIPRPRSEQCVQSVLRRAGTEILNGCLLDTIITLFFLLFAHLRLSRVLQQYDRCESRQACSRVTPQWPVSSAYFTRSA